MPLAPKRAARLAHGQNTHSQDTLPASGTKIASKAPRDGVAERFAAAAVPKSLAVDLARITYYDELRRDVALPMVHTATHHEAHPLSLLPPVPGIGTLLRLGLLYASHELARFPRGQAVVSSGRLGQWARESAGHRYGPSGTTSGQAPLKWAWSEAAVLCLSAPPAAQTYLVRLAKKPGQGKALTVLAQQLARAVYSRRKRHVAGARETCCQRSGRRADAPGASLDKHGLPLHEALDTASCPAALHAKAPRGHNTLRPVR